MTTLVDWLLMPSVPRQPPEFPGDRASLQYADDFARSVVEVEPQSRSAPPTPNHFTDRLATKSRADVLRPLASRPLAGIHGLGVEPFDDDRRARAVRLWDFMKGEAYGKSGQYFGIGESATDCLNEVQRLTIQKQKLWFPVLDESAPADNSRLVELVVWLLGEGSDDNLLRLAPWSGLIPTPGGEGTP